MVDCDEILVPVDGSESADRAAVFAGRLGAVAGVPLKLAYVVPLTIDAVMALVKMTPEQIRMAHDDQARAVLARAQAALAASGCAAAGSTLVLVGDAAQELLSYLETHPRTLVVMGRRGMSSIRGLVLGSVSEKVARHAHVPVTLVH